MALKFRDTPQVIYGDNRNADDWRDRFPPRARPIDTAPQASGTPLFVFTPDGQQHRAIHHSGAWRRLTEMRDPRDGKVRLTMDGTTIVPVMWEPQSK